MMMTFAMASGPATHLGGWLPPVGHTIELDMGAGFHLQYGPRLVQHARLVLLSIVRLIVRLIIIVVVVVGHDPLSEKRVEGGGRQRT